MELFNIDGTIKSSFSIGTGTGQIEFRSFNGKFYYRNYGEPWKEVAGAGGKVRPWQASSRFEIGELVSYNGILYVVLEDHDSSLLFDNDGNKMARVAVFDELAIFDVTNDLEFRITPSTANKIFARNTSEVSKNLYLPDAEKIQVGTQFEIQNDSNISVPILYNDGSTYKEVKSGGIVFVTCISNTTTNGVWTFYDFSVETGLKVTPTKFTNYSANSNELVLCNTASASFTVTLPPSPANGDMVGILDVNGTFRDRPVTIARNGKKIQDVTENWLIDIAGTYIELVYIQPKGSWFFKEVPAGSGGSTPYDIYNNIAPKEPPTISSFTVTGGLLREIGNAITNSSPVDFTVICSPGTDPITTISFTDVDDETVIGIIEDEVAEGGEFTVTYSPEDAVGTDNIYRVSVTDGNLADTENLTVRFVPKVYWGFNDNATLSNAQVLALANNLLTVTVDGNEFSFGANSTEDGAYIYFIYPDSFDPITEIEDLSNGFVYNVAAFTASTANITNGFGSVNGYRIYRTNVKTFGGNFVWKISL
jgi:hypothetical protein